MPILNYTTSVPVDRTVGEIHKVLAKAGAAAIQSEYGLDGEIIAIRFKIVVDGGDIYYALPVDVDGVAAALKADRQFRDRKQAARVAWRIAKDWVEAQMALVQARMAQLPQVFLPYMQTDNGKTVYERLSAKGGMLLLGGPATK